MDRLIAVYCTSLSSALNNLTKILLLIPLLAASVAASASPSLSHVSCQSAAYNAAGSDACTVSLSSKTNYKLNVALKSNNPAVSVPSGIAVKSGSTTAGFSAIVSGVTTPQTASITAQAGGTTSTFSITLSPAPATLTAIRSLSCADAAFTGPQPGTNPCTVTLASAPTSAETIALSSNTSLVSVPSSITVAAGSTTATFTAVMNSITVAQLATLTATADGTSAAFNIQLQVGALTLNVSPTSLSFGNVSVGTAVAKSITLTSSGSSAVTINSATISGAGFSILGASFPFTLNPGQSIVGSIQFNPTVAGAVNGQLTISSTAPSLTLGLTGTGTTTIPTVSAVSCGSTSITGSMADTCTVSLSGSAPSGGLTVSLASNNSAVAVPSSVTVPATAVGATFIANVAAVSTTQTATLTAITGSTSSSVNFQLNAGAAALSVNATSIGFGNVVLNTQAMQSITLTSTGSAPLTINSVSVSGPGFSTSGIALPATLNPGQTMTLNVQFAPSTVGSLTGQLTIATNASSPTVALSGTGEPHEVDLSWLSPPTSSDPVVGYNIYRAPSGTTAYQLLNATVQALTSFADTTPQSGSSYDYIVKSVDAMGTESVPSNTTTVTIP